MQKYGSHVSFEFHMSQMRRTKNIDERSLTLKLLVLGGQIVDVVSGMSHVDNSVTRPVLFISFLDYWQVTLIWSPYGDASLIRSFTYW